MADNFDTLFDQVKSQKPTSENGFDELFDQVSKENKKSERTLPEKFGRLATQFALGSATQAALTYEIGAAHLSQPESQQVAYRQQLFENIEDLQQAKELGGFPGRDEPWNEKDEEQLTNLVSQAKNPELSKQFVQTSDVGITGLAEKATGLNLHPEGIAEKAANWVGFIKNPSNLKELFKVGLKPKELMKAVGVSGTDVVRGVTTGTALEMAEEGKFGPLGTLGMMIAGDISGFGPQAIINVAKQPKKYAAQAVNFLTMNNSKKLAATQLAEDFAKSGLQIDAGTLTGSPLIQMMQARLSQSGLTGTALDNFRKELSNQITREYESILQDIGEMTFENNYQASEAIKDALKVEEVALNIPKESLKDQAKKARPLQGRITVEEPVPYQQEFLNRIAPQEFENSYQAGETLKTAAEDIKEPLKEEFNQRFDNINQQIRNIRETPQAQLAEELGRFVEEHEGSLLLGESAPEARVLQAAEELRNSLRTEGGELIGVTLDQLIKTRRTLGDIANWEFGGSNFQSAYKKLVGDINSAIERTLQEVNPQLRQQYQQLNSEYAAFKDLFENKNVLPLFEPKNSNYNSIYNSFINNPDKLRALEDIFYSNPRGQQLIRQVKRDYANEVISRPNVTARELRDLANVLGPEFENDIANFILERQHALENPLPRAASRPRLGTQIEAPQTKSQSNIGAGRKISETGTKSAREGVRKKMYEHLSKKSPDQIMKQFDTIEGIRKLRRALELTPEGKELFKQLSRYKIAEMIDKKMKDSVTDQVKLGRFSGLLETTKNKAIVKELLGKEAFNRLELLQRNSGILSRSAEKFFNASKSGTTLTDMALVGGAVTGILTGNPFIVLPAIAKIGGSYLLANLMADPIFLKELEKAILTKNTVKFSEILEKMRPSVQKAISESNQER